MRNKPSWWGLWTISKIPCFFFQGIMFTAFWYTLPLSETQKQNWRVVFFFPNIPYNDNSGNCCCVIVLPPAATWPQQTPQFGWNHESFFVGIVCLCHVYFLAHSEQALVTGVFPPPPVINMPSFLSRRRSYFLVGVFVVLSYPVP